MAQKWLDDGYTSGARAGAFFAGLGLLLIQVSINVVDNAVSLKTDFLAWRFNTPGENSTED